MSPVAVDPIGTGTRSLPIATVPAPVAADARGHGVAAGASASAVPFATRLSSALAATAVAAGGSVGGVPSGVPSGGSSGGSVTGDTVVATAKQYLGVPYVWGGTTTSGLDCSGLVQLTFKDLGIDLPRVSRDQAREGTAVPSLDQARPGDLIAFGTPVNHIAIYVGDGKILEAPQPGQDVHITAIHRTPVAIRRIVPPGDGSVVAPAGTVGTAGTAGTAGAAAVSGSAVVPAPELLALWDPASLASVPRAVPLASLAVPEVAVAPTGHAAPLADAARTLPTVGTDGTGVTAAQLTAAGLSDRVASFADQFARAEADFSLPAGLLAAVAQAESGGDPSAVSSAGAQGLMQLMPATARGLGVADPFDPDQAITGAARLLATDLDRFDGSVPLALAAYNAGPGAVTEYGGIPPYLETEHYVRTITDILARLP